MTAEHFHPTKQEQDFAKGFLEQNQGAIEEAPERVNRLIHKVLNIVAQGKDVDVISISDDCSTQEAADLLNVSRTFFVKLLKEKKIPCYKVGTRKRVRRSDVLKYDKERRAESRKDFDEMIKENQELGLYE